MYYNINNVMYNAGKPRPPSSVHIVCARIYNVYISRILIIIIIIMHAARAVRAGNVDDHYQT